MGAQARGRSPRRRHHHHDDGGGCDHHDGDSDRDRDDDREDDEEEQEGGAPWPGIRLPRDWPEVAFSEARTVRSAPGSALWRYRSGYEANQSVRIKPGRKPAAGSIRVWS
jgi:hypothetical protein